MARKKKIEDIESKSSATDSVGYTGSVTLKLTHNKKVVKTVKIKNTGTKLLFQSIASLLAYPAQGVVTAPNYIAIGDLPGQTDIEHDTTLKHEIARVYVQERHIGDYKDTSGTYLGSTATFMAVFPHTTIGKTITISELGLFGSETNTLLARISLGDQVIKVDLGMSLIVE